MGRSRARPARRRTGAALGRTLRLRADTDHDDDVATFAAGVHPAVRLDDVREDLRRVDDGPEATGLGERDDVREVVGQVEPRAR
jgi:hypothetical protein